MTYPDGCDYNWKDHCERLATDVWLFATSELVLKNDRSMDINDWRQCSIRRHEYLEPKEKK